MNRVVASIVLAAASFAGHAQAAPSVADYQRSLGLREAWMTLTENVAWPAQWRDDGAFYYRKTVPGGFAFVREDVASQHKQPAFDAVRLARGLSAAAGTQYPALRLPFERFGYAAEAGRDNAAIEFQIDYAPRRCTLTDYVRARRHRSATAAARLRCGPRPGGRRRQHAAVLA